MRAAARKIEVTSENDRTDTVRDTVSGNKHQTISIKGLFKAAIKAITGRDDDAPQPEARKRRSGEKEGSGPLLRRLAARFAGRPAARGRYARLRKGPVQADKAALHLSDTLDWLTLWQENAANNEQWIQDNFNAKQDQHFPQP